MYPELDRFLWNHLTNELLQFLRKLQVRLLEHQRFLDISNCLVSLLVIFIPPHRPPELPIWLAFLQLVPQSSQGNLLQI